MLAIAAVVLAAIAGVLEIVGKHTNLVIYLVIVAVILVGVDVAWGWTRRRTVT